MKLQFLHDRENGTRVFSASTLSSGGLRLKWQV